MAYIGKTPTPAPLTASDITDGIISTDKLADTSVTNAKLNANIISAETALTSEPADTDEFLISDAGVLKRIDASLVGGGKILQVVTATDTNQYAVSVSGNFGNEQPVSTAFSITPSRTSSKIIVNFLIPMVDGNHSVSGQFVKVYRSINSGSYSALDIAHGTNDVASTGSGNSLFANIPHEGDANRVMAQLGGVFVDTSHNTTNQIDYKFYMGVGDNGSFTVYVNRTANNSTDVYTGNSRTHVVMYEV